MLKNLSSECFRQRPTEVTSTYSAFGLSSHNGSLRFAVSDQRRVDQRHVRPTLEPNKKAVQRDALPHRDEMPSFVPVHKLDNKALERPLRDRLPEVVSEVPEVSGHAHTSAKFLKEHRRGRTVRALGVTDLIELAFKGWQIEVALARDQHGLVVDNRAPSRLTDLYLDPPTRL